MTGHHFASLSSQSGRSARALPAWTRPAWIRPALDAVFPRRPLACGLKDDAGPAWGQLSFIDKPYCDTCGLPFEFDEGADALCAACHAYAPLFDTARAALTYDAYSRHLVLAFKHGGRTENIGVFASQMLRAGRDIWPHADLLMPVPLHRRRLVTRRFNQAAMLARALSRKTGLPYDTASLLRARATPPQGHLSWQARHKNVAGAFRLSKDRKQQIKGKHIVLIDDVMTTGATLNACARVLSQAGAKTISCVTLTRIVRPRQVYRPAHQKTKIANGQG